MKKSFILSLALLASLPGCWCCKKSCVVVEKDRDYAYQNDNEMTEAPDELYVQADDETDGLFRSFFDQDSNEFVAQADDDEYNAPDEECAWAPESQPSASFKSLYFDFNKHTLKEDQEAALAQDIARVKEILDQMKEDGGKPTIVVEGHADLIGSPDYNRKLSEERAKEVVKHLVAAGIPQDCLKVVGRGKDVPVMIDGKPVTGDSKQQWQNRRVELHLIC